MANDDPFRTPPHHGHLGCTQAKARELVGVWRPYHARVCRGERKIQAAVAALLRLRSPRRSPRILQVSFSVEPPPPPLGENPLLRPGLALAEANVQHSGESDDGISSRPKLRSLTRRYVRGPPR
jgi:hypothetical protein